MTELNVDGLRPQEHLLTVDPRNEPYMRLKNGTIIPIEIEAHYKAIETIQLNENVPENIKIHFNTVKNLVLYSWFVYRFGPIAEHQAFVTFEYALKEKMKVEGLGFKKLLQMAVEKGFLKNEGFRIIELIRGQDTGNPYIGSKHIVGYELKTLSEESKYTSFLIETFPNMRNLYSHGSSSLGPVRMGVLLACADGINQLFSNVE